MPIWIKGFSSGEAMGLGKGIGVVVELANGTTTWFFDDEITAA